MFDFGKQIGDGIDDDRLVCVFCFRIKVVSRDKTRQSGAELRASGISMEIDDTLDNVTSDGRESPNRMPVTYPDKGL